MNKTTQDLLYRKYGNKINLIPVNSGKDKEIYIVETHKNHFIILITKKKSLMRRYRFLLSNNLQKNLASQGFSAPDVIDMFKFNKNKIAACHTYIDGNKIENLNNNTAYQIGKTIAEFHLCASQPQKKYFRISPQYRLCAMIRSANSFFRNLRFKITSPQWRNLPQGICHWDLNLSNFIFCKNKIYLIDYDRQRHWAFVDELQRFIKSGKNCDYIEDILNGYNSVRQLNPLEQKYLKHRLS